MRVAGKLSALTSFLFAHESRRAAHRVRQQSASRHHLNSTKANIHAVPLHMAIMLAANSAADKSSCPFGSLMLLEIISVSQLACVSNSGIWGAKPLARLDKAVRSHAYRIRISRVCFLISSSGARVRLSHAAFAVSMRRFPDHPSMDGYELRLFSFPERDVVVPTLRDAHQQTSEPPFPIAARVIFEPNEPPGSSLPRWATVKGVPNYRKAGVRGFMRSVALSTHAKSNSMFGRVVLVAWRPWNHGEVRSCLIDSEVVCLR